MSASRRTRNLLTARLPIDGANESSPIIDVNPYVSPAASALDVAAPTSSSLLRHTKRSTGNDLILSALLATLFGLFTTLFIVPFIGFLLDAVSLFLLARVVVSRSTPSTGWIVCGALVAAWNVFRLFIFGLIVLITVL